MCVTLSIKPFSLLTTQELYDVLKLRAEVFIVEQACVYQDLDGHDQTAMHLQYRDNGLLVGCARILPYDATHMSFGRLITAASHRKTGLGKRIMDDLMTYFSQHHPNAPIFIKAQAYLESFYARYGFTTESAPFMLEGCLHLKMIKRHDT